MQKFNSTIMFIAILMLLTETCNAQYKLSIGNFWVYSSEYLESRIAIIDTATFFNSVLYYQLESISRNTSQSTFDNNEFGDTCLGYYRKKINGFFEHLIICKNPPDTTISEDRYYKYNAQLGEKWIYRISDDGTPYDTVWAEVVDVFEGYQFGEWRTIKKITYWTGLTNFSKYFCDDFGELSEENYLGVTSWLKGCYIDSIAYGDTSFVVVSVSDDSFPGEFNLSQNYPNPFNPTTSINYSIPKRSNVKLIIYDIKGEEVALLINEIQTVGNYEVNFDGSKFNLTSGIYFYTFSSDNFIQTKKMIYLK